MIPNSRTIDCCWDEGYDQRDGSRDLPRAGAGGAVAEGAARALVRRIAIGYVKGADDRIEKDPDTRVRATIDLIFRKFAEFGSVRQVYFWLDQQQIQLPIVRDQKMRAKSFGSRTVPRGAQRVEETRSTPGPTPMGVARRWCGWTRSKSEFYRQVAAPSRGMGGVDLGSS